MPPKVEDAAAPLSQRAYEHLVGKLFRKELVPGDFLNRRQVAAELDVSVAPVLEAMVQLEAEGFLVVRPRKGTQVRPLRGEDLRGQLIVRVALECQVARMCCGRAVADSFRRLERLARASDAVDRARPVGWEKELSFHRALADLTGCASLRAELDRTMRLGHFLAVQTLIHFQRIRGSHMALLRKLRAPRPDEAERAMRRHLVAGREDFLFPPAGAAAKGGVP